MRSDSPSKRSDESRCEDHNKLTARLAGLTGTRSFVRLRSMWGEISASLWFVPGVIVLSMVVLAVVLIEIDVLVGSELLARWSLVFGASASGARGLLEAVAGSMITVAGVVFSVTLVTLSLASSQYSTRVVRNFMDDRVNQSVLGVFVGTFTYCLIVLRTIRGRDEGDFVPSLAVLGGMLLALVGVGFLIHFIHHIATSVQATAILARLSDRVLRATEHLFPEDLGTDPPQPVSLAALEALHEHVIRSTSMGYITDVDSDTVLRMARDHDVVIRMERGVGEFVIEGAALVTVLNHGAPASDLEEELVDAFVINSHRTIDQDAAYGVQLIADLAIKALSPGINDPTTAIVTIDHLMAILIRLANRRIESPYRFDRDERTLRVIARGPNFEELVSAALDGIRHYARGKPAVLDRLLDVLNVLDSYTLNQGRRDVLAEHARAIREAIAAIPDRHDRDPRQTRVSELIARLEQPAARRP